MIAPALHDHESSSQGHVADFDICRAAHCHEDRGEDKQCSQLTYADLEVLPSRREVWSWADLSEEEEGFY